MHTMDSVFSFPEAARHHFLHSALDSLGCTYICLWSYSSSSNRLRFLDGFYNVPNNQASSSSGSVDRRLLDRYRGLEFDVSSDNRLPGLAFRNHQSFLELQQSDLLRLAWTDIQRQFFQEARIKTTVFLGCSNGEIELGFSTISQGDIQTDVPEEFSRHSHPIEQNNPLSSSSSSLRSLSTGSPESYSLLIGNVPGTSLFPDMMLIQPESEHDAIIKALLHVISSPSSHSTSHQQNLPHSHPERVSAFKRYSPSQMGTKPNLRRQSLMKKSFQVFRGLNFMRMRERIQATRPTSTQIHHMISERRRREKLNENFQALRSLLPPGTKKDKASILTAARETLRSFVAENDKVTKRNQQVEAQILAAKELTSEKTKSSSADERTLNVRLSHVPGSSSSGERFIDLHVTVGAQSYSQLHILIRLLEFLKEVQPASLISMSANTHIAQGTAFIEVTLRLKIEDGEWDETAFQEAVRRVVADLAQ